MFVRDGKHEQRRTPPNVLSVFGNRHAQTDGCIVLVAFKNTELHAIVAIILSKELAQTRSYIFRTQSVETPSKYRFLDR